MKSLFPIFFLVVLISIQYHLIAQSKKVYDFYYIKYICKNANGTYEYLRIDYDNKKIWYSSSLNKQDIPLIILNPEVELIDSQKGTKVKFPNDNKIYVLKGSASCANIITCYNPDGSTQEFHGHHNDGATYRCINPNNTIEYLYLYYTNSKNMEVKYSSSKNPNWIKLNVVYVKKEPSMMLDYEIIEYFDVKFPNDNNTYRIIIPEKEPNEIFPNLKVKNPDGTIQKFRWINNQ